MANIWFSSDPHLGHANILTFKREDGTPTRVFKDIDHHDEYLIERHNSVVKPQDKWYCLGDVAMNHKKFLSKIERFNGHKRLVLGNHDAASSKEYLKYFEELYSIRVLDHIAFTHIPIHPESLGRFTANVHGHIHHQESPKGLYFKGNKKAFQQRYINVSMEALNDYTPVSLEEIKQRVSKWKQEYPI